MSNIIDFLGSEPFLRWVLFIAIILVSIFLSRFISRLILKLLFWIAKRTKNSWDDIIFEAYRTPLAVFITFTGLFIALKFIPYVVIGDSAWDIIIKCYRSILIIVIAWGFYNAEAVNQLMISSIGKKLNLDIKSSLIPILSKTLRVITLVLALLIIMQEWDFGISGLITGLGIGSLAIALAAQDVLSNIFGGIVILFDRPFELGDWIETELATGAVEDINFRSVRIRTFSQTLVTVSNSSLVNVPITNYSRMGKRGVSFNIGLTYSTSPQTMKICTDRIKAMLIEDDDIDKETIVVVFDNFGDSSLNLAIHYFTKATAWLESIKVKENVYYKIMDILAEEKAEIAFPTQTIYLNQDSQGVQDEPS